MPTEPRTCLIAGTYPPAPGPYAAATVAAVRRAWDAGQEVVVASPRPSAAPLVIPVAGAEVGRSLARLRHPGLRPRRQAGGRQPGGPQPGGPVPGGSSGRPATGSATWVAGQSLSAPSATQIATAGPGDRVFQDVVVCLEPGWPLGGGHRPGRDRPLSQEQLARAAKALADALSEFERAELVVTGSLGVPGEVLALLWPYVDKVFASSEEVATALRNAGAPAVTMVEPYAAAGLPVPAGVRPISVSPLEPADWLLVARGRRLIGSVARKVLGPRAPAVRAYLLRAWIEARKTLSRLR